MSIESAFKGIFRSKTSLCILVIFVFFGLAIVIVWPSDKDFVILHRKDVIEHSKITTSIIRDGLSTARARITLTEEFRKRFGPGSRFVNFPEERVSPNRLTDLITADLNIVNEDIFLDARIKVIPIFQATIDRFFRGNSTYVVVETFNQQTDEMGELLYKLNLSVLAGTSKLFGDPPINESSMVREISEFFLKNLSDSSVDCADVLCLKLIPWHTNDIEMLADSFDALASPESVGSCKNINDKQKCLETLRHNLIAIANKHEGVSMAEFGLLLVELVELGRLAENVGSTDKIATSLDGLYSRYLQLTEGNNADKFIANLLTDGNRFSTFMKTNNFDSLDLKPAFLKSFHHYMAGRDALKQGDFTTAADQYRKVQAEPAWFKDYLESFIHMAEVGRIPQTEKVIDDALNFFKRTDLKLTKFLRTAMLGRTIRAKLEALPPISSKQKKELLELSEKTWREAIEATRTKFDRLGARIEHARTVQAFGDTERAKILISEIEKELEPHADEKEYRMASMSTALYFAHLLDFEKAKKWLKYAVQADPRNLYFAKQSSEFKALRLQNPISFSNWIGELNE